MHNVRVAIIRGGPSNEYDSSLKTGAWILKHLPESYTKHDIFVSRDGLWHREGMERSPERALAGIDVVINAMRGRFGEDGKVQKILDQFRIPYTGSNAMTSGLVFNKALTKQEFERNKILTPYYTVVRNTDDIAEKQNFIFHHFYLPFVVKPVTGSSSIGVTIVKDFRHLGEALEKAFAESHAAIVEEYIRGKEAVCHIVDNFRDEKHYVLLPAEIHYPDGHDHFTTEAKHNNSAWEFHPGNFSSSEKQQIQNIARRAHEALGLRHYSSVDLIITPNRGAYILEVNTHPHIGENSVFTRSLDAVGASYPEFLKHITELALAGL